MSAINQSVIHFLCGLQCCLKSANDFTHIYQKNMISKPVYLHLHTALVVNSQKCALLQLH